MNEEANRLVAAHSKRVAESKQMLEPATMAARLVALLEDAAGNESCTPERLNSHAETIAYAIVAGVALKNGGRAAPPVPAPRPGHGRRVEDVVDDHAFGVGSTR